LSAAAGRPSGVLASHADRATIAAVLVHVLALVSALGSQADASAPAQPAAKVAKPRPDRAQAIRVLMVEGKGVSKAGFTPAHDALAAARGLAVTVVAPADVKASLAKTDVIVFMGGSGSRQGEALGDDGRQAVREFVLAGGGYVGVCAGAFLALQGKDEFFKLRLVASQHATGDFYRRGVADLPAKTNDGKTVRLHYENGPIFGDVSVPGLQPVIPLAKWEREVWSERNDTHQGEMLGTAAIVVARHGEGRVLLFSPNPALGEGDAAHPELLVRGASWAAAGGDVPAKIAFADVFAHD
jgi:hypothetical protein